MFRGCRVLLAVIALVFTALVVPVSASPVQAEQGSMQPAPDFPGITRWINSPPLSMRQLRGKVVLVDFWAYSCINCLRTLPYVTRWYDTYKDKGFVVVGVHTPEFEFGMDPANVERAVKHFGIHYPVAMDNNRETWKAWHNQYWPEEYLVNRAGEVVAHHIGEGSYAGMENAIRQQLGLPPIATADHGNANLTKIGTPEMEFGSYFGTKYFANAATDPGQPNVYRAPASLALNRFALDGRWRIDQMYATLTGGQGAIHLHFHAGKVFMVASSSSPVTLKVTVDGKPQPPVTVQESKMYTLYDGDEYTDHQIVIEIPKSGLQAYSFTFG